ncbi:hypothetical protein C2S52_005169 [Perilla frutescens var. hirtella]|nr:hypothetical protein C2S52_005169 [Perilla frutescens var. hirtella]
MSRPTVLTSIGTTLLRVGGQELLGRFEEGCFGHLIRWKSKSSNGRALHALISREITIPGAPAHEVWFRINESHIRFSFPEYTLVTGFRFGSSTFDPNAEHNHSNVGVFRRFCGGNDLSILELWNIFCGKDRRPSKKITPDDYLKVANILALYFFACGYDTSRKVDSFAWVLVDDLEAWNRIPWGAYTYPILLHYIARLPRSTPRKYHFYGPIWAYEAIPALGREVADVAEPVALPRCLKWLFTPSNMQDFHTLLNDAGECQETLHAGADEEVRDYWISVLVPDAQGVVYRAPINPVKAQRGGDDVVQRVVRTTAQVRNISCRSAASVSASAPKRQPQKKQKQAAPPESAPETETDSDVRETRKKHTPPPTSGKREPDHHSAYQFHHSYQWDQFDQNYQYTGLRASSYMPEADRTSVDGGHTRRSLQMQIDPRELIDKESFWRSMVEISTTEYPTVSAFPYQENQDIHIDVPAQEEEFDNPPRRVKKQSTALRTPYISTMPTPIKAAARNAYINWRKKRPTPFVRTLATHFELDHAFFDRVENMQSAMDATIIDLFCEAMIAKLERGKQLLDGVDAGSTRIVGPSFFFQLEKEWRKNVDQLDSAHWRGENTDVYWWEPFPSMVQMVQGRDAPGARPWWDAKQVIFVCCVNEHWLTVLLDLIEWRVDVYDFVGRYPSMIRGIKRYSFCPIIVLL